MKKKFSLLLFAMVFTFCTGLAQHFSLDPVKFHVFDADSLRGFDEQAARASAISEGFINEEFPIRMYDLKRSYINNKYNLWKPVPVPQPSYAQKNMVVPACVNEDFEASDAGTITASNQIQGWTVTRGLNQNPNNSCNLNGCCPSQPEDSELIEASSGGHIDPIIGPCYPIFSVFGDGPANTAAASANTHIPQPMRGTKFIRINSSQTGDRSIEKLSKTFSVTSSNALFQFAFIVVFSPGHGCCDAGAFKISLPGITCPTFSASAPSAACTNTASGVNFLVVPAAYPTGCSSVAACSPYTGPTCVQYVFNKWQVSSMDLTQYIGQTITIDIVASDCTAGGHFGTVFFDAQCGPMSILGNGTPFPAGDTNVTLPTCGPNGATICATPGLGPYSWEGPNIPSGFSTPSYSNQCFTTSVSATYTLLMHPPGGCAAFKRVVTVTVTPAPTLVGTVQQATCGDTIAVVSVTPGGSAGNPAGISWYPPPYSLSTSTTVADYIIPPVGSPTMVVTVVASDQIGCPVTLTLGVRPPAPVPDFTVVNNSGTYTISCLTPSISLDATTTYTYGTAQFFWSHTSFTSAATGVVLTNPGIYQVTITDPVSQCAKSKTISIGANLQMPVGSITPTFQNITCTTGIGQVCAVVTTPTVNFTQLFMSPLGGSFVTTANNACYLPGTPGTFTYHLVNQINGCRTTKTFTVASSEGFPTFELKSAQNFSLGCNTRSVAEVNIDNAQAEPGSGGAVSYSLLLPGSTNTATPSGPLSTISVYNISTPGSYTVITKNNANDCETRIPISILSNTAPPGIDSVIVPNPILSCYTPSTTLKGISFTNNVNYRWHMPQNLSQAGSEFVVNADFSQPTQTTIATYTLVVEDNSSTCINTVAVVMSQNLFLPVPRIALDQTLTCVTPSVVLTNDSEPAPGNPYPTPLPIIGELWEGPTPQQPRENSTTYDAYLTGTYTMTVLDLNNGCRSTTVVTVSENREIPLLNTPAPSTIATLGCGVESTTLTPAISTTTNDLVFAWDAFSNPTATMSCVDCRVLTALNTGTYVVRVTNTENGCSSEAQMEVLPDTLTASFVPDKTTGYAPLTVEFQNTSFTEQDDININSFWVFGNAATASLASVSSTTTTYSQPGTYTVTLFAQKGECLDSTHRVIVVDIPSDMKVPNVFTPNGDKVNDLFFLQRSSNLSQINATIFDRWGNKVYEINSDTGQIEWDGNNMYGKPSPAGTYFYIITAKGHDGKEYDEKGTLSLIR